MQITRTQSFKSRKGAQTVSITVDDLELTEAEWELPLDTRAMLLDLMAEQYVTMAMYRMGAFHRNEEQNQRLAAIEFARISKLRTVLGRSA